MLKICKYIETEGRLVIARGEQGEGMSVTSNMYRVSLGGNEDVLKLDCHGGCTTL